MKHLSREFYIATVLICFMVVCLASTTLGENLPHFAKTQPDNKAINAAISEFLKKSNNIENMPDITKKKIREKVLSEAARKFFSNQSEPLEADVYLFTDVDTEEPWFRGWYTRITDSGDGSSIAVIGATQYTQYRPSQTTDDDGYLPGYLAIIVQEAGEEIKIYEEFPEKTEFETNRDFVLDDPGAIEWEKFYWRVVELDEITDEITHEMVAVAVDDKIELTASLGPRLPYNSNIQWLGPEGMVEFLQIVPLHWFVYSLGSAADYTYSTYGTDGTEDVHSGTGYAHQESNWGSVFPPAWIWSEGINKSNTHQYALSGGELDLNGYTLTTWFAAYHSPRIQWQFRPTLPGTKYTTYINACTDKGTGSFTIIAEDAIRKLEINVEAEEDSFIEVSVPTVEGFSHGAKESFSATVEINAYIKLPWFDFLIDDSTFYNAALEFGGEYLCEQP